MQRKKPCNFVKVGDSFGEDGTHFIRYSSEVYDFEIAYFPGHTYISTSISTHCDAPRYTPDMYVQQEVCENGLLKPVRVKIQTASYGALSPFETEQVIQGLRHAVDTAAVIQEKFIGPIRARLIVFGDLIPQEKEEENVEKDGYHPQNGRFGPHRVPQGTSQADETQRRRPL